MVKAALFFFLLAPIIAYAVTPEELQMMTEDAAQKQRARDARVKPGQVDRLLPEEKQPPAPRSSKYGASSRPHPAEEAVPVSNTAAPAGVPPLGMTPSAQEIYTPPARRAADNNAIRSDAVPVADRKHFGITIGTWFKARLNRNISNAEMGLVEIRVEEDVPGTRRTLPAGTLLFAEKNLNEGTKRIELRVVKGITPNGFEFRMGGIGFDLQRAAGLYAIITANQEAIAERGVEKGFLSAGRAAASTMGGRSSVVTQAARGAADSVLSDTSQAMDRAAPPTVIGYAAPQMFLIRVEETF